MTPPKSKASLSMSAESYLLSSPCRAAVKRTSGCELGPEDSKRLRFDLPPIASETVDELCARTTTISSDVSSKVRLQLPAQFLGRMQSERTISRYIKFTILSAYES